MPEPLVVLLHSSRYVPADVLDYLTRFVPAGFRWRPLEQGAAPAERAAAFAEADFMFAYPGDPKPEELAGARRLKLFQMLSAGYDWLDLPSFVRHDIAVASNDGSNAVSTAEHAVMLMLALLKQLPVHHQSTAGGEWLAMARTMQLRELRGRTVGLVGFGQIARHVARRVHAFDAQVVYTKTRPATPEEERPSQARFLPLDELLATADILSLHLPLRPETRGMIGARALARMKPGSWLVNTARGALVDEPALVDALRGGHLAGAGLDVFVHEPIDPASPLLSLPNVVLTPHIGGVTRDAWAHRMQAAWGNVLRVQAGEAPRSRVA